MGEVYKLQLKNISKSFPGVKALDRISLNVRKGTVHSLAGENGAGKSTMMKIINGLYHPDEGEIWIDGKKTVIKDPLQAASLGIAMIYQELRIVPELTVEQYLFLGREPRHKIKGFIDTRKLHEDAVRLLKEENITYDPKTKMGDLTVSEVQMLEIAKATSVNADLIIMDEPTSSLTNYEVERLFEKIDNLKKKQISILYISHKMDEMFRISDDISVMRDGQLIETRVASQFSNDEIVSLMVGRKIDNIYPCRNSKIGEIAFEIKNFSGGKKFQNVCLHVHAGEIVGMAGLVGAGRTETMRAVYGLDSKDAGTLFLDGKELQIRKIRDAINAGIMMVTEERSTEGFIGMRSIMENISLPNLHQYANGPFIDQKQEKELVSNVSKRLNIKAPNYYVEVQNLSGGNQQKVVLAKWILANPRILILDEPTRGIDVGAKYEIYKLMNEMAAKGIAIVMISSELPEIIGMCDRVYVMCEGRISGELAKEELEQERIMKLATGGTGV